MSLITDLLANPANQSPASRFNVVGGWLYMGVGFLLLAWPEATQVLFRDPAFAGHEAALVRIVGMAVMVIGWLTLFGGRSGTRTAVAASVFDRLLLVPLVLVPLALSGVFPHLLLTIAVLDPTLAIISWVLLRRA